MGEVFDADFTTANAKGLLPSWIIRVHVLPHVLPVSLEAVGSGLRIAVASLAIVEYVLLWNGIGFVALQAIALRDPVALTACVAVLGTLFALTSLLFDLRRTASTNHRHVPSPSELAATRHWRGLAEELLADDPLIQRIFSDEAVPGHAGVIEADAAVP